MSARGFVVAALLVASVGTAAGAPKPSKPTPKRGASPVSASAPTSGPTDPYAPADPYAVPAVPPRLAITDLAAVQGLLAVQHLGGWLLVDRDGQNPIARRLVAPTGAPTHTWFYWLPAKGAPIKLVHASEQHSFDHLAGTLITYTGHRDLTKRLGALLKGVKVVAVEYSARAAVPAVSRVDAGTLELIKAAGVKVATSSTLVQYAKAMWGDPGRTSHHVAAHHLAELRKDALAWLATQLAAGGRITEYDVQQRIARGMKTRGLVGPAPTVAAGVNAADPYYVPTAAKTATIQRGDLIEIGIAAKVDQADGIYAALSWVAVADKAPTPADAASFATVKAMRDAALALLNDRVKRHKPLTGAEVDRATRLVAQQAGVLDQVMQRTGHSLDDELNGSGADLDDFDVPDPRILTVGTGFTVGPGLYLAGAYGMRSEVSAFLAPDGVEVTTPLEDAIEPLFK